MASIISGVIFCLSFTLAMHHQHERVEKFLQLEIWGLEKKVKELEEAKNANI